MCCLDIPNRSNTISDQANKWIAARLLTTLGVHLADIRRVVHLLGRGYRRGKAKQLTSEAIGQRFDWGSVIVYITTPRVSGYHLE